MNTREYPGSNYMKIYTKKGDKGYTSLFGGTAIKKNSVRLHAYGTVDELNSVMGLIISYKPDSKVSEIITELQKQLFVLGADLATLLSKKTKIKRIGKNEIQMLENWIDELDEQLPELTSFILPGGSAAGSVLHLARTICRRAERFTVELKDEGAVTEESIIYLNRLSDLLFVIARYQNFKTGIEEIKWMPGK
jgi:cob(I)alamin adenosyltransferase